MKTLLITILVICGAMGSVVAQKKNNIIMGDMVIGELTGKDDTTREITIKYPGKEGPEIFNGILVDSYKLRTEDGYPASLQLSEIMPGMHIRVFYKSGSQKVDGQQKKINKISRLDVLGEDRYFRVRKQLNLAPLTAIAPAENDPLPASSPLKVYLSISYNDVHQELVEWINKWNRKNGDSYGKLEPVSDLEQADISIIVARGSDTLVAELPFVGGKGNTVIEGVWTQGTSYLVVKDAGRLKVLWTAIGIAFRSPNAESSSKSTELVIAEMEKRMKARAGNVKKSG